MDRSRLHEILPKPQSFFFLAEMEGIKIVHQFDLREAVPEKNLSFGHYPNWEGRGGGCPN